MATIGAARSPVAGLAASAAVVAAVTLLLYPLSKLDPGVSSGVLYVLGVLLLATHWGLWLGLVTSAASALAISYFHVEPTGSFSAKKSSDAVAIGVLLLTSVVASVIADRARLRTFDAEKRLRLEAVLRRRDAERIRLREVHTSRARVVAAADEERRRLVRDLHDGAQQGLVHTVVALKLARRALADEDPIGKDLVGEALAHAERSNAELRELARGILPSALTNDGLRAAVDGLASRASVPVAVDVAGDRFPAAIEATAYFVVAEALTNVVKHSRSQTATVVVRNGNDILRVQIRDDGVGGATSTGSGLLGLSDRLAVLGGQLQVESPPGRGTLVVATIPVPSA
jgi:signal transduction histidine kinase